jgi:hypothetical protein
MIVSASAGFVLYTLTASFAGIDWLESLTPEFHSSIYGLLHLTFQILAGFAFAMTVALSAPTAPTFRYGEILLAAVLLWAYNHAMQYIIIWSGNIPEEVVWYLQRQSGVWGVVLWALVLLQFLVPFFALLSDRVRNGRRPLLAIAALTVLLRFVEAYLFALPGGSLDSAVLWLAVPGTVLAAGGVWWIAFTVVLAHVRASSADMHPLADGFDPAGSPAVTGRAS